MFNFIKKTIYLIFFPFLLCAQNNTVIDKVISVVGDNVILYSDLENQYLQIMNQGYEITPSFKCQIFEDLLYEKLLLHHAVLDSVVVDENEVESAMDRRIDMLIQQIGSRENLEEFYEKSTLEIKEDMRELMKNQLTAQRMQEVIISDTKITPSEVKCFFNSFSTDSLPLIDAEIEIAHIVIIAEANKKQIFEIQEQLLSIKKQIEEGSNFSTMAILYSKDPGSAKNGGLYKGVKRGQFVKEFEAVAFALKTDEISEPFKTKFGWHIVQLIEKKGQEIDLRHILLTPKITQEQLNQQVLKLDSIKKAIQENSLTFKDAVETFSEDTESKFNNGMILNPLTGNYKFELNELDKSLFYAIEDLKIGELSNPIPFSTYEGKNAFRILMVKSKSDPHKANLENDYQKIQEIALENKKNEKIKEWVQKKIAKTFIRINSEYLHCQFSTNWIIK